jgi:hypothetical protein
MRKHHLLLAVVAALGLSAGDARALLVTVTYDVAQSNLLITSPTLVFNAASITGTLVVTYDADAGGNIIDGPASLDSASILVDTGVGGLASIGFSGTLTAALTTPAASVLTGNSLADFVGTFLATGTLFCAGFCTGIGTPAVNPVNELGGVPFTGATVNPLTAPSQLLATMGFGAYTLGGTEVLGSISLIGNEISRSVIPEPGTVLLLASGVIGLASLGRKRAA